MHWWGQRATDQCPRCNEAVEDATHVWICRHPTNRDVWERNFTRLRRILDDLGTCPQIRDVILLRLRQWSHQQPLLPVAFTFPGLQEALSKQDLIGWQAAFEGCWATEWADVQEQYFRWDDKRNSGKRWLTAIIRKLWETAWDLWDERNHYLHRADTTARNSQLQQDIRDEFLQGFQGLSRTVRHFTNQTLQSVLATQPASQNAWLIRIRAARCLHQAYQGNTREARLAREQRQATRQRLALRQWLIPR
jgi:hypothetical protein